jgi:hypothetical protein
MKPSNLTNAVLYTFLFPPHNSLPVPKIVFNICLEYSGIKLFLSSCLGRLCVLVVRVPACRPRGPGSDSRRYQSFSIAVGLERGPLSLVRMNEELLE